MKPETFWSIILPEGGDVDLDRLVANVSNLSHAEIDSFVDHLDQALAALALILDSVTTLLREVANKLQQDGDRGCARLNQPYPNGSTTTVKVIVWRILLLTSAKVSVR